MQGCKDLLISVRCNSLSLRHMIPDDHLLVRIHEAKELEFSFIYEITQIVIVLITDVHPLILYYFLGCK